MSSVGIIDITKLVVDERKVRINKIKHKIEQYTEKASSAREKVVAYAKTEVLIPIISSDTAPTEMKDSMLRTIAYLDGKNVVECIDFIKGLVVSEADRPNEVAKWLKDYGFKRFEDVVEEFRTLFTLDWLEECLGK